MKKETWAQCPWQGSAGSAGTDKPFQLCGHIWGWGESFQRPLRKRGVGLQEPTGNQAAQ